MKTFKAFITENNATTAARRATQLANEATHKATKSGTRANHRAADAAHSDAEVAWKQVPGEEATKMASEHNHKSQFHLNSSIR